MIWHNKYLIKKILPNVFVILESSNLKNTIFKIPLIETASPNKPLTNFHISVNENAPTDTN